MIPTGIASPEVVDIVPHVELSPNRSCEDLQSFQIEDEYGTWGRETRMEFFNSGQCTRCGNELRMEADGLVCVRCNIRRPYLAASSSSSASIPRSFFRFQDDRRCVSRPLPAGDCPRTSMSPGFEMIDPNVPACPAAQNSVPDFRSDFLFIIVHRF